LTTKTAKAEENTCDRAPQYSLGFSGQQRPDGLATNEVSPSATPQVDTLAARGVRLSNAAGPAGPPYHSERSYKARTC